MKTTLVAFALCTTAAGLVSADDKAGALTFYKDVVPVLQKNCQTCHRPGEIGPMSLMDYKSARPFAKAMKQAVATRKMPPWFADRAHGKFANDRSMSQAEIDTIVKWADSGAAEGKPSDAPPPLTFVDGWNIPKPDMVVEMPNKFTIPASGKVDYQYIVVPMNITEPKWVQMAEARPDPGARSAVHHVVVYVRAPESKWLRGEAEPGIPFVPPRTTPDGRPRDDIGGMGNEILTIYTPGNVPDKWERGRAKLIRPGSDIVFQMHYTPSGKEVADKSKVGIVFARNEDVKERVATLSIVNTRFAIPPGDPNYRVDGAVQVRNDAYLLSFFPHMHVRGKAFEYRLKRAEGEPETLLKVPAYNFNWQLTYHLKEPIKLEAGMRMEASGWFDNSANNPFNPDPKATVRWGEQSWEEMMIGFFDIAFDARLDPRSWMMGKKPGTSD